MFSQKDKNIVWKNSLLSFSLLEVKVMEQNKSSFSPMFGLKCLY